MPPISDFASASASTFRHPDRSDPALSCAPHFGAPGRGVEGPQQHFDKARLSFVTSLLLRFLTFPLVHLHLHPLHRLPLVQLRRLHNQLLQRRPLQILHRPHLHMSHALPRPLQQPFRIGQRRATQTNNRHLLHSRHEPSHRPVRVKRRTLPPLPIPLPPPPSPLPQRPP